MMSFGAFKSYDVAEGENRHPFDSTQRDPAGGLLPALPTKATAELLGCTGNPLKSVIRSESAAQTLDRQR